MTPRATISPHFHHRRKRWAHCESSALMIVLGCLAIISVLIVAFMLSAGTERQSARFYANSSSVKLLAASTVSVVIGQIQDATKGIDASGNTLAWASQPGMIRTYNTSGPAAAYYKLYSWDNMDGSGAFDPSAAGETPPSNWQQSPALYTDLNDPVSGIYPIVDPAATSLVEGFSINGAPASSTDAAPMPVQWLYVLRDGSLETASGGAGTTVTVSGASASNPIVGRIAFWTDDDTCKVNINTAAGDVWTPSSPAPVPGAPGDPGSFWDIPRTYNTSFEENFLAKFQPAQNEYQRYPGHPATTYLSAVFPSLTAAQIDAIAPRIAAGGSNSGTQVATGSITPDSDRLYSSVDDLVFTTNMVSNVRTVNSPLTETQIEQAKFFLTAHSRAPEVNLYNEPRVVIWPVSSQNDASHRTPYDNLIAYCGTLNHGVAGGAATTPYDYFFQRGAYDVSSTTGCNSPTADLPAVAAAAPATDLTRNRQLISYLRNLTSLPVPGFGTGSQTFLSKYPKDRDEILTEIFDYIRGVNAQDSSVSGLTPYTVTSTSTRGATGQGQIIPIEDTVHSDSNTSTLRGFGRFPTVREAALVFVGVGQTDTTANPPVNSVPPMPIQLPGNPIASGMTRVQAFFVLNFIDPSQGYAASVPNFQVSVSGLNGFKWGSSGSFPSGTSTFNITKNYNTGNYGGYKGASMFIQSACPKVGTGTVSSSTSGILSGVVDLPTNQTFSFTGGTVTVTILDTNGDTLQTLTMKFPSSTFPVPGLAPELVDNTGTTPITVDFRNLSAYDGSYGSLTPGVGRFTGCGTNTSGSTSTKMWLCSRDVVRSMECNTDPRIIAAMTTVPSTFFSEMEPQYDNSTLFCEHSIAESEDGTATYPYYGCYLGKFLANANYGTPGGAGAPVAITTGTDYNYSGVTSGTTSGQIDNGQPTCTPIPGGISGYAVPIAFGMTGNDCTPVNGVYAGTNNTGSGLPNPPGDFDTGMSVVGDGAFVNKADEGSITGVTTPSNVAYYSDIGVYTAVGGTFFSPNRQLASAVSFGSLPTGVESDQPWQTLLFHPDPGGTPQHIGAQTPPDYLLLDLFDMPVVEPYAISDPFSTAGKVNMNYQIVPFTYLTRSTALQAVLKPEQIMALGNGDSATYKTVNSSFGNRRYYLDLNQTLTGFTNMFSTGTTNGSGSTPDIFRSASQICSIYLVPQGQTYNGMPAFWNANLLTGDNVREEPYNHIYPRLTTKSNSFTVHYRVQTLKKIPSTPAGEWIEGTDVVTAEYRGSSTLERYLDLNNTNIPDYATQPQPLAAGQAIDNYYKFRVVETKQFVP